ncbi:MAG: DUF262 domain-containing protein [Candidatus Omnitrophica bacterium]|nr:DUF262 domain-containing protein [Candidatus Omnitrophota bacterium]
MKAQQNGTSLEHIGIDFYGIGHAIRNSRLQVPMYQRNYAWEKEHVEELLGDLAEAIWLGESEYFIGSIVLTNETSGCLYVTDGQQRLATVSIIIAAIRNYFSENGEEDRAKDLENMYLLSRDLRTRDSSPRLRLNAHDHGYFESTILNKPVPGKKPKADTNSHRRLKKAMETATNHIQQLAKTHPKNPIEKLFDWIDYLENCCKVIWVTVPDDGNAFTIFETLNDRGLDLAISDLLKNFLFHKAAKRLDEVQGYWTTMTGILEATSEDKALVTYLRHYWSSVNGLTRERDLYKKVKKKISSVAAAANLAKELSISSVKYAALSNINHVIWQKYGSTTRGHIEILNLLRMTRMRPLLLAILDVLSVSESKKALKYIVDLAVRTLIVGTPGGNLESKYSIVSVEIREGKIKTAGQLRKACNSIFPNDTQFRDEFAVATSSKSYLSRYYLRALEQTASGKRNPEFVPNPNSDEINLEHVLPIKPHRNWTGFTDEQHKTMYPRLGNLSLMKSSVNSVVGNAKFSEKKKVFAKSSLKLTKSIARKKDWKESDIINRQKKLATLAVKTWSGKFV